MKKFVDCCETCGTKQYRQKVLPGITIYKGLCPFCKKQKWLIPSADWAGFGD